MTLPPKQLKHNSSEPTLSSHQKMELPCSSLEKERDFAKEKKAMLKKVIRELKKLQKKEHELIDNLEQSSQWTAVQHEGDLIKSSFASIKKGATSLTVHDWLTDQQTVIPLDPLKTPQQEMAARFRKAKKLQRGIAPLTRFLAQVRESLQRIKENEQQIERASTAEELSSFRSMPAAQTGKEKQKEASPIYREYVSASGLKIWVGKNAKANDRLTFQLANGRDWWLHIRDCPGSHVVLRITKKNQEPDSETMKDALQLALYFSKARASGEGEVCVTQKKYVSKMRGGKAGQAQISQEKTLWVRLDVERIRALLTS